MEKGAMDLIYVWKFRQWSRELPNLFDTIWCEIWEYLRLEALKVLWYESEIYMGERHSYTTQRKSSHLGRGEWIIDHIWRSSMILSHFIIVCRATKQGEWWRWLYPECRRLPHTYFFNLATQCYSNPDKIPIQLNLCERHPARPITARTLLSRA